jgi:hypothetical protein
MPYFIRASYPDGSLRTETISDDDAVDHIAMLEGDGAKVTADYVAPPPDLSPEPVEG